MITGANISRANYHGNPPNGLSGEMGNKMTEEKYGQTVGTLNTGV